jgi:hypothetical protein
MLHTRHAGREAIHIQQQVPYSLCFGVNQDIVFEDHGRLALAQFDHARPQV